MNKQVDVVMYSSRYVGSVGVSDGEELAAKLLARERFEALQELSGDWGDLVPEYDGLDNWKEFIE